MVYKFKNEKGFFADPVFVAVISDERLQKLHESWNQKKSAEDFKESKESKNIEGALSILNTLPRMPQDKTTCDCDDLFMDDQMRRYGQKPSGEFYVRTIIGMTAFRTASSGYGYHRVDNQNFDWDKMSDLLPFLNDFNKFAIATSVANVQSRHKEIIKKSFVKKMAGLLDKMKTGDLSVKEEEPAKDLVAADCFAIYIGGNSPGFLDGRGNTSPSIAGARLFESEASAKTTVRSRSLRDAAVVTVKAQMMGVVPGEIVTSKMEPLQIAIADMQKKALLEAIGLASESELEDALLARKAQKRRM